MQLRFNLRHILFKRLSCSMKAIFTAFLFFLLNCYRLCAAAAPVEIFVNQVAYEQNGYKTGVVRTDRPIGAYTKFELVEAINHKIVFTGFLQPSQQVKDWSVSDWYAVADFSDFNIPGIYNLIIRQEESVDSSYRFSIERHALA